MVIISVYCRSILHSENKNVMELTLSKSEIETAVQIKYQWYSSLNIVSRQPELCHIFIFGMAYLGMYYKIRAVSKTVLLF